MPKLNELIKVNEITLPVSGVKVRLRDALTFDDDLALRQIEDATERGGEAMKRVLDHWDIYLDDGETMAPPDQNTLGQLPKSDYEFLIAFIARTVNRPRTEEEMKQQAADAAALQDLARTFEQSENQKSEPEPAKTPESDDDEVVVEP